MFGWESQSPPEAESGNGRKSNKKDFYRYIDRKWKTRESVGPLLNENGDLVTWDVEKAEVLNTYLVLIFAGKTHLSRGGAG